MNFHLYVIRREKGVVSAVKKQGHCGACWAYSVISTIESNLAIHMDVDRTLSTQQMIDCAQNGNKGCTGGDTCLLLEWLRQGKIPIFDEETYPMTSEKEDCKSENLIHQGNQNVRVMSYTCDR